LHVKIFEGAKVAEFSYITAIFGVNFKLRFPACCGQGLPEGKSPNYGKYPAGRHRSEHMRLNTGLQ